MVSLEGIFFAEFDNKMGPKITYEAPQGLMNSEAFDAISECMIPKPRLFGKLVSTYAFGKTYLGMPQCIEGAHYERNRILFNVGLVLQHSRRAHSASVSVYEPIVRKIGRALATLEAETSFLSKESLKQKLSHVLESILYGLKEHGRAVVPVDEANILCLVLLPRQTSDPIPNVHDHDVPVPMRELSRLSSNDDLVFQRISPFIDGVRYVKQIAEQADVDTALVIQSIQQLVYEDLVRLVDIFQYSNIYTPTPSIGRLAREVDLQQACVEVVTRARCVTPPRPSMLFSLYSGLGPGLRFADFCIQNEARLIGIDKRRFITFGLVNGLIRRVFPHPLYIPEPGEDNLSQVIENGDLHDDNALKLSTLERRVMDGRRSLDDVCCTCDRSPAELADAVAANDRCILVYK